MNDQYTGDKSKIMRFVSSNILILSLCLLSLIYLLLIFYSPATFSNSSTLLLNSGKFIPNRKADPVVISDAKESAWTFTEEKLYVRCDLNPAVNIPQVNWHWHIPSQQVQCVTYNSLSTEQQCSVMKDMEKTIAKEQLLDSVFLSITHTRHIYYNNEDGSYTDVGGHFSVVHHNCHSNFSLADTDTETARYIHNKYGPTSFELRLIGAEMDVIPLTFMPAFKYTQRQAAILSRSHRPSCFGDKTGEEEIDNANSRTKPLKTFDRNLTIGRFCPVNAWAQDHNQGIFNPITCRLHGKDQCLYEGAYAVSVSGEYSIQLYLLYIDYESVSNVPPRIRWPRSQNALIFQNHKRILTLTPQPWPRPKSYTDFIQYTPLLSPLNNDPLQPPRSELKLLVEIPEKNEPAKVETVEKVKPKFVETSYLNIENEISGRWVKRSVLSQIGIHNGSVWWNSGHYKRPYLYFCQISDINKYVYVPYSFDHLHRMMQFKTGKQWTFIGQEDQLKKYKMSMIAQSQKNRIDDSFAYYFSKAGTENVFNRNTVPPLPIFTPPLEFSKLYSRSQPYSFKDTVNCLGGKRLAFAGDSQTRQLVGFFLSVLAGEPIVLKKQKWKGEIPLVWDCRTITLSENPAISKPDLSYNAAPPEEVGTDRPPLAANQMEMCYFPMSDFHIDYLTQAFKVYFDTILVNVGQHPVSFEGPQRSFPKYTDHQRAAFEEIARRVGRDLALSLNGTTIKYYEPVPKVWLDKALNLMQSKLLWWSTMPFPRSLQERYFIKTDGDGRTNQRIELMNEAMKGFMTSQGIQIFDQTESIHWPFVDCCQDDAHGNELTFNVITAQLFAFLAQQLQCDAA